MTPLFFRVPFPVGSRPPPLLRDAFRAEMVTHSLSPSRPFFLLRRNDSQGVRPGGGGAAHPGSSTVRRTLSIPKEFPGLLELSSSELSAMLTDRTAFAKFLHGTDGAKEARAFTRDLRHEIEGMCRVNIEMAEEAADLRGQMQVIRSCDMQPVKEAYEAVKARVDELRGRRDLSAVLAGLKERAAASDEASERLSEELVEGKVNMDDFVERYMKMREAYHRDAVRATVVEPHVQQQQQQQQQRQQPPPPPPPPPRQQQQRIRQSTPSVRYPGM